LSIVYHTLSSLLTNIQQLFAHRIGHSRMSKTLQSRIAQLFLRTNVLHLYAQRDDVASTPLIVATVILYFIITICCVLYIALYTSNIPLQYIQQTFTGMPTEPLISPNCACASSTIQSYQVYSFWTTSGMPAYPQGFACDSCTYINTTLNNLAIVPSIPISDCVPVSTLSSITVLGEVIEVLMPLNVTDAHYRAAFNYNCTGGICILLKNYWTVYFANQGIMPLVAVLWEEQMIQPSIPQITCSSFIPQPWSTSLVIIAANVGGIITIISTIYRVLLQTLFYKFIYTIVDPSKDEFTTIA
jgi:hypothetical protein